MYSNLIVYYKFRNFLLEVSKQNFQKKVSIYRQFGCKTALGEAKIELEHDTVTWQMNHGVGNAEPYSSLLQGWAHSWNFAGKSQD